MSLFQLAIYVAAVICGVFSEVPIVPFPHFKSWFMERPRLRTKESVILLVCHGVVNNLYELLTWDFRSFRVSCALWVLLHFCDITFLRYHLYGPAYRTASVQLTVTGRITFFLH